MTALDLDMRRRTLVVGRWIETVTIGAGAILDPCTIATLHRGARR